MGLFGKKAEKSCCSCSQPAPAEEYPAAVKVLGGGCDKCNESSTCGILPR